LQIARYIQQLATTKQKRPNAGERLTSKEDLTRFFWRYDDDQFTEKMA